jgi:hypothetical protein
MRRFRLAFVILVAAMAVSATACTNPVGPKPTNDNVQSSGI